MEIGTEISQKIRSAIKAKLIELGAYVDDELPDYIMVMVANKKTQRQMTDDLSLFLSSNTEKFTSWLHGLLKKLQSINTGEPSSSKHKVKEKEKHKLEKKKPKPLPSEKPTEKPKTIKPAEAVDSQRPRKSSTGEVGRQRKSSMGETERVKKGDKEKRASLDEKLVRPAEPETTDEIKLSEDTDEFREEAKEIAKKELVKSNSSVGKPPPAKVAKSDRTSDVKKPRSSLEEPSRSKQQSAPERSKERTHSSDSRRKPSSYVGTVKRKYELEEEEEEEYDPLNPAVGSVASVVKGPSRKSSVPKAMQANKSLLMKAVNEAEKSISSSKKVDEGVRSDERPVEVKHRLKTAAGQQLMSRSKRHEMNAKSSMHSAESDEEPPKKTRRSSDGFENLKYTVRNEGAAGEKPAAKVSPKSRTSAIAPARVATSALRELNKISSSQARQHVIAADSEESLQSVEESEDGRGSDESDASGSSGSEGSQSEDEEEEEEEETYSDSDDEVIEIADRCAQTLVNMREKNYHLIQVNNSGNTGKFDKETQTESLENGLGDSCLGKLSKDKLQQIDDSLLNMFIENMMPFELVEKDAFKLFAKTLQPRYHFPKKKKLMTHVGLLYNSVKDKLQDELSNVKTPVLSHSRWHAVDNSLYDTISVTFISNDWKYNKAILKTCRAGNNFESSAELLRETIRKWGFTEVVLVTEMSENESKILEHLELKTVPCFGSCIQAAINECLNIPEVQRCKALLNVLAIKVQENSQVAEMLEKKIKELLPEEKLLVKLQYTEHKTWDILHEMISVFTDVKPALQAAVVDSELIDKGVDLRNLFNAVCENSILESLGKLLSSFRSAIELLTHTEDPTLQKVIPIFVKLEKVLELEGDDGDVIQTMKECLRNRIEKDFKLCKDSCLLACLLHPQTKQMAFVSQAELEHVTNLLLVEIKAACEGETDDPRLPHGKNNHTIVKNQIKSSSDISDVRKVIVSTKHVNDCSETVLKNSDGTNDSTELEVGTDLSVTVKNDWLDDVIQGSEEKKTPKEVAKYELNLYMAEPASNVNPLQWWMEKSALYPHVSQVARQVLAVPASCITVDQAFAISKNPVVKNVCVKPEHVDMMVFLKENKHLF
ncbi:uncharacterized protein LOC127874958 isoform X1 [Dreissena polymorpha]|uniref:uncharacterized protein LOC127874958 isoform X1 n=1 Tax=Dreissena polymorpha TaxID=45954 RepID=UPI0022656EA2|nr:uncharacterized protein LOC127874958 isoform X1 [Dreissena polymorpha]